MIGSGEGRLRAALDGAAAGSFPPEDGEVEVVGPARGAVAAVAAFTAHHIVATEIDPADVLTQLEPGSMSAPLGALFLTWLAERSGGRPGSVDLVLAARGGGGPARHLQERPDLAGHPRDARAARYREGLRVLSDAAGLGVVMMGRGLAGRWEMSVEIPAGLRRLGHGRRLISAGLAAAPVGPVYAQVAPGNAASLRAFLAAGFRPIGAEVLISGE